MTSEKILFYIFSAILIFAATMVITRRNPVHSALFLVLAFFTSAFLWMLMEAEFLAIVLVLVYVGAVMVLFLFVVMMLDVDHETMRAGFVKMLPVGLVVAGAIAFQMILVVGPKYFGLDSFAMPVPHGADYSNTKELGRVLYTVYMYPVEIASVILLVGIIAAIGLTLRTRPENKRINPAEQVLVTKGPDRVRVVKMATEKKMEVK